MYYWQFKPAKTEPAEKQAQVGVLKAMLTLIQNSWTDRLFKRKPLSIAWEIYSLDQKTHFYLVTDDKRPGSYLAAQVTSLYPRVAAVGQDRDPLAKLYEIGPAAGAALGFQAHFGLPLAVTEGQEWPPLTSVLAALAKAAPGTGAGIQVMVRGVSQAKTEAAVRKLMRYKTADGTETASPYAQLYQQKLKYPFLAVQIRLLTTAPDTRTAEHNLTELAGAYGSYTLAEGNALKLKQVNPWLKTGWWRAVADRRFSSRQPTLKLNLAEAAGLWLLPDQQLAGVKNIDWGKTVANEAPDNLPVVQSAPLEEQKREINFFAKTEWRNQESVFGIKREDRRKHLYVIGKTGTGKSTLLTNMAVNDIRNGEGVAVIDPHGDTCEMILDYIPKRRINDVVYLDPTLDEHQSFSLNLFDASGAEHTDVVASGIISVFYKLYQHSWGPRLEYILRNAILSLLYYEGATFVEIIRLLTDPGFRRQVVEKIRTRDPVLADFWTREFDTMNEKLRMEAISPILNKVGQFLSSQRIRHIVGSTKSTFDLETVMNERKILLLNLATGKLGEDTTALLGAMFITKMQLTAMKRVNQPEETRPDFYLYVDEFQNFATTSFVNILSEARKYRLNLIMANQYIGQVDEEVQKAIFGNVGSLTAFVVGARDAGLLEKEFGGVFTSQDMVNLGKYEILMKLAIDGLTSEPFMAKTLPPPQVVNHNREKIINLTKERYYRAWQR